MFLGGNLTSGLSQICKLTEVAFGCFAVCCVSFFWGIIHAQVHLTTLDVYLRPEFAIRAWAYAFISSRVCFVGLGVARILHGRGETKIADAVIRLVAIDVVDDLRGVLAVVMIPCKAMGEISPTHQLDTQIALAIWPVENLFAATAPRTIFPVSVRCLSVEAASFWAIVQYAP